MKQTIALLAGFCLLAVLISACTVKRPNAPEGSSASTNGTSASPTPSVVEPPVEIVEPGKKPTDESTIGLEPVLPSVAVE